MNLAHVCRQWEDQSEDSCVVFFSQLKYEEGFFLIEHGRKRYGTSFWAPKTVFPMQIRREMLDFETNIFSARVRFKKNLFHIHLKFGPFDLKIGPVVQHTSLFGLTMLHLMKTIISRFFLLFPPRPLYFQGVAMQKYDEISHY